MAGFRGNRSRLSHKAEHTALALQRWPDLGTADCRPGRMTAISGACRCMIGACYGRAACLYFGESFG